MTPKKKRNKNPPAHKSRSKGFSWVDWPEERILDLRLCDLGVTIEGTVLERRIDAIHRELDRKDILFRPHFWLSNEWFCPDGVPGIAIPFYLAHPRLSQIEKRQMFEVEGGNERWCMKILRHEVGHAIDNAFRLRNRKDRRRVFGKSSTSYPEFYSPKPFSKSFVLHLDSWYAQSHPDEDFAETFAVWLSTGDAWLEQYAGWPALRKLEYVDTIMGELIGQKPPITKKTIVDPLSKLKKTLREHYREKRALYGTKHPSFYDRDLKRLFSDSDEFKKQKTASSFLKTIRQDVRSVVSRWTGEYQYTIDRVLEEMIRRCADLRLHLMVSEDETRVEFTVLLAVQTMNYLHGGRHRIAM